MSGNYVITIDENMLFLKQKFTAHLYFPRDLSMTWTCRFFHDMFYIKRVKQKSNGYGNLMDDHRVKVIVEGGLENE